VVRTGARDVRNEGFSTWKTLTPTMRCSFPYLPRPSLALGRTGYRRRRQNPIFRFLIRRHRPRCAASAYNRSPPTQANHLGAVAVRTEIRKTRRVPTYSEPLPNEAAGKATYHQVRRYKTRIGVNCNGVNQWHPSRRHLNLTGSRSCCDLESSCAMKAARSEREVIGLRTSPRELWLVRSSLAWVAPITP
jgi:hypothetical protein